MHLGFFTMPIHPPGRDWRETLREDQDAYILADELGYTEALCGEHVTDAAENITSCLMFLSSLVGRTKRIRLGTGTINIPNSHPAAIAGQVAMLDHMLDGRFIFGISPGGLLSDAEAFGNLGQDRAAMFLEGINMVLDIWAKDPPYGLKGKYWNVTTEKTYWPEIGQGIIPKPFQRPHPPIAVTAVAPHSKGVAEAAARGWIPISANFLMPCWVKSHWPKFVEGRTRAGLPVDAADWRVAKSIFVADDDATAREYATGEASPYRFYYRSLMSKLLKNGRSVLFKEDPAMPDDAVTLDTVTEKLVFHGSVNSVVDQILAFRAEVGDFGTLLTAGKDWRDPKLARRSMQLMAEQVMPRVNAAIAGERRAAE